MFASTMEYKMLRQWKLKHSSYLFFLRMTVHRNKFLCNKTN